MQKIEEAKSASTINNLTHTMLEDFMQRVRSAKQTTDVSSQIQNICDYISVNPGEKFSIAELAEKPATQNTIFPQIQERNRYQYCRLYQTGKIRKGKAAA